MMLFRCSGVPCSGVPGFTNSHQFCIVQLSTVSKLSYIPSVSASNISAALNVSNGNLQEAVELLLLGDENG